MAGRSFLNGRVTLHAGDCLEVLPTLDENSIDSCVCDPPYHLTSIVKRFGGTNAAPAKSNGATGVYERSSRGFMSKIWDGGDIAFRPETWAEVLRVLKPGSHLLAFGAPKNYHRLAVAIEDGGFEIRDCLQWLFGSGFPKSHDVSKGIDRRKNWSAMPRLQSAIGKARRSLGVSQSEAARRMGLIGPDESLGGGGFMWFETGMRMPTREQWPCLKAALSLGDDFDECFEEAEREITGVATEWTDRTNYAITSKDGFRRDKPASDSARQWEGWGSSLKPAYEPVLLARKPLDGTIAANVLRWGVGAINIDGCRVGLAADDPLQDGLTGDCKRLDTAERGWGFKRVDRPAGLGRWPANIILDGSDEVVAAFPDDLKSGDLTGQPRTENKIYGSAGATLGTPRFHKGDSGSAARFFYTAKADADDRIGSKHPTVKPLDLMQYLVRLVTPPRGTVLDPFAGTGTTAEAAWREGFSCTLIEREAEYIQDIERRMALCLAGPDERARESIKARLKDKPQDHGPLFDEAAA